MAEGLEFFLVTNEVTNLQTVNDVVIQAISDRISCCHNGGSRWRANVLNIIVLFEISDFNNSDININGKLKIKIFQIPHCQMSCSVCKGFKIWHFNTRIVLKDKIFYTNSKMKIYSIEGLEISLFSHTYDWLREILRGYFIRSYILYELNMKFCKGRII